MKPSLKLIIFDLDGTLVNAYPAVSQSVNHTLSELGFPKRTHQDIKRSVGWGDRQLMAQFVGEDLADKAIRIYRPHHAKALGVKGNVKFLLGTQSLLRHLSAQGFKLAIATNRPSRFTALILKTLGIREYFDMVLCADKAPKPKPSPDILWVILKQLKMSKAEALYVGDMGIDIETGRRAGVNTVAVCTGSSSASELKALKPYQIINRIGELKKVIKSATGRVK